MSHPLRKQARYVQRKLSEDKSLEPPSYQWCLQMVQKYWDRTRGKRAHERKEMLVAYVRDEARPKKDNPHRKERPCAPVHTTSSSSS